MQYCQLTISIDKILSFVRFPSIKMLFTTFSKNKADLKSYNDENFAQYEQKYIQV